jgi:hypothetical protein
LFLILLLFLLLLLLVVFFFPVRNCGVLFCKGDARVVMLVTSVMQPSSFVMLSFVTGMSRVGLEEAGVVAGGGVRENKQHCQKYSSGVMAAWKKE